MREQVTESDIQAYRTNGFVAIPDFLSPAELEIWRELVDDAVAARGQTAIPGFPSTEDPAVKARMTRAQQEKARYYQQVFTQRVNLWQTDERVRGLILDERLGKVVAELAGVEGVRVWHDQALIKQPWSNPTAYHLDVPYWSFTSPEAISIWVALDDATCQNGCLYYIAGTHRSQKFDNVGIGPELGAIFEVYPEWRDLPAAACPIPAGGALFHNGLTCHGAGANMTSGQRRAMTCAFMPDGSTFNGTRNILPQPLFDRLKVGDPLDDNSQNPLVFSHKRVRA
jgi:ectoine hydroxylase-related dioxygenase (phytanoyl-CoA dioxygenase family)